MTAPEFLTALSLNAQVTATFAHRQVPRLNAYWHKRADYITTSPGYYFIPVYCDLLIRQGVSGSTLLAESTLTAMEEILDSVARFERKHFDFSVHIENCRLSLTKRGISNLEIAAIENELVNKSFEKIPENFRALTRANTFLYAVALASPDYSLIFRTWENLMPLILFLDDIEDLKEDQKACEENSLLEGPGVEESFFQLHPILLTLTQNLQPINRVVYHHFNELRLRALAKGIVEVTS